MSYIPAALRRSGYIIPLPPRGTGPHPSALDQARQAYLRELNTLALATPAQAAEEAETTTSAARQLLQLAADARQGAAR